MANRLEISEQNFMAYLERLTAAVGHADRHEPLRVYLEGLLLPGDRKSVEPMAARIDPRHVRSRHQSMHHFVATAPWDAQKIIQIARDYALEEFEHHGGVQAWVLDDTSYPKKGLPLGRCRTPVLRRSGKAGELPGRSHHVGWPTN
jgi:SRSO17 transposase